MYISFSYKKGNYSILAEKINEIVKFKDYKITQTETKKDYLLGIISYRNNIVTIIDLPARMKIGKTDLKKENLTLIILKNNFGFIVDEKIEVFEKLENVTKNVCTEFCEEVGVSEQKIICHLNIKKLFSLY